MCHYCPQREKIPSFGKGRTKAAPLSAELEKNPETSSCSISSLLPGGHSLGASLGQKELPDVWGVVLGGKTCVLLTHAHCPMGSDMLATSAPGSLGLTKPSYRIAGCLSALELLLQSWPRPTIATWDPEHLSNFARVLEVIRGCVEMKTWFPGFWSWAATLLLRSLRS